MTLQEIEVIYIGIPWGNRGVPSGLDGKPGTV